MKMEISKKQLLKGHPKAWIFAALIAAAIGANTLASDSQIDATTALARISDSLQSIQMSQGQWQGAIEADPTVDLMPVLLSRQLGLSHPNLETETLQRIFARQDPTTGLWSAYPGGPPSEDVTAAILLVFDRLGPIQADDSRILQAKAWIESRGGAEKQLGAMNKMILGFAGIVSTNDLPPITPLLLAFPKSFPINIYNMGFGRTGIVPYLVWEFYKNQKIERKLPAKPLDPERLKSAGAAFRHIGKAPLELDGVVNTIRYEGKAAFSKNGLLEIGQESVPTSNEFWAQEALGWILARQQPDGTWAGALQITYFCMYALREAQLAGVGDFSVQIAHAWEGIMGWRTPMPEGFVIQQSTEGPIMDTARVLTAYAAAPSKMNLLDATRKRKAMSYLLSNQILTGGDWQASRPKLAPGGWAFEYYNSPYPDSDDTGMVLEAVGRAGDFSDPKVGAAVDLGVNWLLGMQNKDGGFPTWDHETSKLFNWVINHPEILREPEVQDVSQGDITSRVLRGFVAIRDADPSAERNRRLQKSIEKACRFLEKKRTITSDSSLPLWRGEWMVNYLYGTSESTSALLETGCWSVDQDVPYAGWLMSKQQNDGGWGESPESYPSGRYLEAPSTLTQTEFVLESLMVYERARLSAGAEGAELPSARPAIEKGIRHLLTGIEGQEFPREEEFTGVFIRGVWYARYLILPHYEAIRTLGMYLSLPALPVTTQ
jgi:squalene-hopene/tetraprenyl-beta-curcumene cyclase